MIQGVAIASAQPVPCKAMIGFDEAIGRLMARAVPLGSETVALEDAAGRILAEPVSAGIAMPRVDTAAMDGYAVRSADIEGHGVYLRLVDSAFPAVPAIAAVQPGQAVRIFTGAPMPLGADQVVMQEYGRGVGDGVVLLPPMDGRTHVRKAGCDFQHGRMLLPAGRRLDAQALMVAAAADCGSVAVWRQPRIALLATGDEIVHAGRAAATPGHIPDSISPALRALCREKGALVGAAMHERDDIAALRNAAARLHDQDILIVTGGASIGDRDHCRRALADAGMDMIFAGVAMKPGKPVWYGQIGACHVVGLPGNPAAALMTARLFLLPLLHRMTGQSCRQALDWTTDRIAAPGTASGRRDTFLWACRTPQGVRPLSLQQASMQHMLAQANAIVHLPHDHPGVAAGAMVRTLRF